MQSHQSSEKIGEIHVVADTLGTPCNVWLGLTKKGDMTTSQFLDSDDLTLALHDAAEKGLQDTTPVLLSETGTGSNNLVFLCDFKSLADVPRASLHLEKVLGGKSQTKMGLYLEKGCLGKVEQEEAYFSLILGLVQSLGLEELYVLVGRSGHGQLLDLLIKVKSRLSDEKIQFMVYH